MATALRKKSEAPEGEVREGEEMKGPAEEEMDSGKTKSTSRKRSAKAAKNTKAPMDGAYGKKPMDAECGCSGKKGGKCDGSCGGAMRKRGDAALTPQEYLAACDLGIQDRSRSYIRAHLDTAMNLTPSTLRTDLKCGKGSISPGEKCTKGAATQAKNKVVNKAGVKAKDKYSFKKQQQAWGKYAQAGMGVAGALIGATSKGGGGVAGALGRGVIGAAAGAGIGRVLGTAEGTLRAAGNRTTRAYSRNRENSRRAQEAIKKKAPAWEKEINTAYKQLREGKITNRQVAEIEIKQAREIDKIFERSSSQVWTNANRRGGRRDSVYAAGFTTDLAQLAI